MNCREFRDAVRAHEEPSDEIQLQAAVHERDCAACSHWVSSDPDLDGRPVWLISAVGGLEVQLMENEEKFYGKAGK